MCDYSNGRDLNGPLQETERWARLCHWIEKLIWMQPLAIGTTVSSILITFCKLLFTSRTNNHFVTRKMDSESRKSLSNLGAWIENLILSYALRITEQFHFTFSVHISRQPTPPPPLPARTLYQGDRTAQSTKWIATNWRTGGRFRLGHGFFLFTTASKPKLGSIQDSYQTGPGGLFR
jgi:hypothetical protein